MGANEYINRLASALFLWFVLATTAHALQQQIRVERIGVEHGLSHPHVTSIIQDQSGFIWIGTQDGLNRYDGYEFVVYRHDPGDSTSLADSEIRGLAVDEFGNLWVGTRAGLNRLNRGAGTFTRFQHDPADDSSLSDNDITKILVDHESVLWVGTKAGGLNRFDSANESFERFQYDSEDLRHSIADGPIAAIYEDPDDRLWVATRAHNFGALDQFDRETNTFIHTYGCPDANHGDCNIVHTGDEHRPVATDINSLLQDSTGAFWMATDTGATKDHEGWLASYNSFIDERKSISSDYVVGILEDQVDTLWFATSGGGLNRKGPDKQVEWYIGDDGDRYSVTNDASWASVFDHYRHDSKDSYSLSSDYLTVLYEDRFGVIWIGTADKGVNKFHPASMRFGHYKHDPKNPDSLSHNHVSSIAEDSSGNLWLGTFEGVLNQLDRSDGKLRQYWHQVDDPNSLPSASIHALHVDQNGVVWIGTWAGLSRFDPTTQQFKNYDIRPIGPSVLEVLSITEDAAGMLWLGTTSSLTRFDSVAEEFTHIYPNSMNETSLHGEIFYDVVVGKEGYIWAATVNAGVNKFDPVSETAIHYRHDPNNPNGLSDDHVTSIYEDRSGAGAGSDPIIWIGTRAGLDRFDTATQTFTHFDKSDGLPDNHVVGVAAGAGYIWITTESSGVSRYDPATNTFENFTAIDGLQGNRFIGRAIHVTRRGEVILSGFNGINAFDPRQLHVTEQDASVVLTQLLVNGEPLLIHGDEINLPSKPSELDFKFAALAYANPARTKYTYMLEGYDKDWTVTDATNRVASYHNITPGEYTFRVRAKIGNSSWNEENMALNLSIPKLAWQTNWAYLSYAVLLVLSVYLVMHMRSEALRRRATVLEASVAERTRQIEQNERLIQHQADHLEELLQVKEKLYTNISHEFRTPLTLILGPIERMLRRASDSDSAMQLSMVRDNSQRLLRLVDQLLGLSRLSAEEPVTRSPQPLTPLATTIVQSFQPLAEEKGIRLDIVDGEGLWVNCAPDALEKIILNLVSNAIKYTLNGGWVKVQIATAESEFVRLSVSDSGIGIDPKDHEAVFERFFRSNGNGGESAPGAGLGLALVKELAEAFGGSVELKSRPGLGTTIGVLLPRHRVRPLDKQAASDLRDTGQIPLEVAVSMQSPRKAAISADEGPNGQPSMLVIEDNANMQQYLVSMFSDSYHCQIAADGEQGVKTATEQVPDIVICDVMLPGIDGFEVSKILKNSEATSHIPIVMLTGRGDHDSRIHGLREHVDDYVTKPFDDEELSLRIANLLSTRDTMKRRYSRQLFDGSDVSGDLGARELQFLDKLQTLLEENYADPDFKVDQLASAMAMSDRQLQRKLKALVDHSPAEYLRSYRLAMARKKLREGTQVGLVAEAVGFSSQAYFASCFKAEFGSTPSQFRRSLT